MVATTQVTLTVTSDDEALRTQVDELHAALSLITDAGKSARASLVVSKAQLRWPLDIPIVPARSQDESAAFEVALEAWSEGRPLAHAQIADQFVSHALRTIAVSLQRDGLDAGAASAPSDAAPAGDAARGTDASMQTSAPDGDALLPPALDAGPGAGDAGPIASDAGPDARPPGECPPDHGCKAPYPCVPTALGYTCRGQFADWPMPDGNAGAKTAQSYASDTQTVTDNVTKLVWQIGIPTSYPSCDTEEGAAFCTRQDAIAYCDDLTYGGYDDWRLPTLIELVSLFHSERGDNQAGIDVDYFGDTDNFLFVSSSIQADAPSAVWKVNYWQRRTYSYDVPYGRVRCVRGGAEPPFATPADRYAVDANADTVSDRATGLVWKRSVPSTRYMPSEIGGACSGGFRIPTTNELLSLVDPTRAKPAIDPVAFPDTPSDVFWVSPFSAVADDYAVSFETGELSYFNDTGYVRCVR